MNESSLGLALVNILLGHVWVLLLLVGAGICLAVAKYWISAYAFCAALAMYGFNMSGFSAVEKPGPKSDSDWSISVLSISVRSSNPEVGMLLNEVLNNGYDIIALQELQDHKLLADVLLKYPEYQAYYQTGKSTAILSRFPAVEHLHIKNLQRVIVKIDAQTSMAVYNLHAPKFSSNLEHYNKFFADLLAEVASSSQDNMLIMGDFNSTQHNYWRRQLLSFGLQSALHNSGRGWLGTFPTEHRRYGMFFPFLSIDDVYSRGVELIGAQVLDKHYGSDHYPVHVVMHITDTVN